MITFLEREQRRSFFLMSRNTTAVALGALLGLGSGLALADEDGHAAFNSQCAQCHRPDLKGALGPALTGKAFTDKWGSKVGDLKIYIKTSMPQNAPGSLPPEKYAAITDYILSKNGLKDGK